MAFQNNNTAVGISSKDNFQVGDSDVDTDVTLERRIKLGWSSDPVGSYMYYDCTVGVMLDSGIVVHNRLPQVNRTADSLASTVLNDSDMATITDKGVNLQSNDQYQDIVQRMGHSRYWFRIWGVALRVGYKVPIPAIKMIGGVPAIPYDKNVQWAFNRIFPGGNYGGIVLWHAEWSLWYTTAVPPFNQDIPIGDPSALITAGILPPSSVQAPFSQADDDAVPSAPGGFSGGKFIQ